MQPAMSAGLVISANTRSGGAATMKDPSTRMAAPSALDALHPHFFVGESALFDDHFVVEDHRAVAHRHVVVPARPPLAAAFRVGAGREQEIAREHARRR